MQSYHVTSFEQRPALVDLPPQLPKADEVQIDIKACGLNFADLLMTKGKYQDTPALPFSLGMEPAGVVTATGADVTDFPAGARVAVFSGANGLAEQGCFPANRCVPIPDNMSFVDAAGFQIAYGTSHVALDYKAQLKEGETLLVLGAAGGVGLTAVEIGKLMGARVIACARGADKLEICKRAGADHLIDTDTDDLRAAVKALGGADVVYDAIGGALGEAAFRATNPDGRFLFIGFASGDLPTLKPNHMLVKNITSIGFYWGGYLAFKPEVITDSMRQLLHWYEVGKLTPHVSHQLPLSQADAALELLRARKSTGKVVVTMGDA